MAPTKQGARKPLEALDVTPAEERAYECLLAQPGGVTVQEIARALAQPVGATQRLLGAIEAKGLATHSTARPRRYIATAPDIAMEALILKRQEDLQAARARVEELKSVAAAHRTGEQEQLVELIVSREAQRQAFEQLRGSAQRELICLTRLPIITSLHVPDANEPPAPDPRGLRRRCIVDQEYLGLPGAIETVRYEIQSGENTRMLPQLPLKLILADRRIALIPMNLEMAHSPALLVRSSALLDALYALFEMLWQQAAPISLTEDSALAAADPGRPGKDAENLLALLAAGLNDKTIAHRLDLSLRTLKRRISVLMRQQKARTRFQLAWSLKQQHFGAQRLGEKRRNGQR